MTRKLYWGLGVLVLLIGAFSYVIYQQYADIARWKEEEKAFVDKIAKMDKQRETQKQSVEVLNTEQVQPMSNDDVQITDVPVEHSQRNDGVQSNKSYEDQSFSTLTSTELDELYQQMSTEISQMNSDEELNKGLDLTQYTQRQRAHLFSVGINLSLLPEMLADKIIAHQQRKKGLLPPPAKGEITLSHVKRTSTGGMTIVGSGELRPGETIDEFTERMIKSAERKLNER